MKHHVKYLLIYHGLYNFNRPFLCCSIISGTCEADLLLHHGLYNFNRPDVFSVCFRVLGRKSGLLAYLEHESNVYMRTQLITRTRAHARSNFSLFNRPIGP